MIKDVKISSTQLTLLIIGFIFGNTAILNPATAAYQDGWLAFVIGWIYGFILIAIYAYISLLNPSKTLIEILKEHFGKVLGNIIAAIYIWYMIHEVSAVIRNSAEYMVIVNFPETPLVFIIISILVIVGYALKKGLEVVARLSEMLVPLLPITVIFIFFSLITQYDINNFFPFLERGFIKVLEISFSIGMFPFSEAFVFLMIFPYVNKRENVVRASLVGILVIGLLLLNITIRDIMVLGSELFVNSYFPPHLTTGMIPGININPLISTNLLIGSGTKITLYTFASVMGITQLFNLDDYKPFVLPVIAFIVSTSIWIGDNFLVVLKWGEEIWPYYAFPFQIGIPILLLIISLIKNRRRKKTYHAK